MNLQKTPRDPHHVKPSKCTPNIWLNNRDRFGLGTILLHWLMAVLLIGSYFLGDYMVTLDYYDRWYHRAPDIHKSIGMIIGFLLLFRIIWTLLQPRPAVIGNTFTVPLIKLELSLTLQKKMAHGVHLLLYSVIIIMLISGYLISTAKGQGVSVFGWLEIPALLPDNAERGEIAGKVHQYAGMVFIITVCLHIGAALLHHFVLGDRTLKRMLRVQKSTPPD